MNDTETTPTPFSSSRREFTLQSLLAMLAGVTITITGCGGGSGGSGPSAPSQPGPTGGSGDRTGSILANHGHTAVITSAQLMAGGALSLEIRGGADHSHTVSLTAMEVVSIRDGQRVSKTSTAEQAHDHVVTFN